MSDGEEMCSTEDCKTGQGDRQCGLKMTAVSFGVISKGLSNIKTREPSSLPQGSDGQALGVEESAFQGSVSEEGLKAGMCFVWGELRGSVYGWCEPEEM